MVWTMEVLGRRGRKMKTRSGGEWGYMCGGEKKR